MVRWLKSYYIINIITLGILYIIDILIISVGYYPNAFCAVRNAIIVRYINWL